MKKSVLIQRNWNCADAPTAVFWCEWETQFVCDLLQWPAKDTRCWWWSNQLRKVPLPFKFQQRQHLSSPSLVRLAITLFSKFFFVVFISFPTLHLMKNQLFLKFFLLQANAHNRCRHSSSSVKQCFDVPHHVHLFFHYFTIVFLIIGAFFSGMRQFIFIRQLKLYSCPAQVLSTSKLFFLFTPILATSAPWQNTNKSHWQLKRQKLTNLKIWLKNKNWQTWLFCRSKNDISF